jgi:hypothetical protein
VTVLDRCATDIGRRRVDEILGELSVAVELLEEPEADRMGDKLNEFFDGEN